MMFISAAWAQDGAGAGGGMEFIVSMAPILLIFVVFYFLLIRPQQKKQKEHQAKIQAARRGDKVLTGGGIYGSVTKVFEDGQIQVEIAEGVRVRVASATLMDVLSKTEPVKDSGSKKRGKPSKKDADKDADKDGAEEKTDAST